MELRLQTTLTTWLRLPVLLLILRERQIIIFKHDGLTQLIAFIYVARWAVSMMFLTRCPFGGFLWQFGCNAWWCRVVTVSCLPPCSTWRCRDVSCLPPCSTRRCHVVLCLPPCSTWRCCVVLCRVCRLVLHDGVVSTTLSYMMVHFFWSSNWSSVDSDHLRPIFASSKVGFSVFSSLA